ncbi:MAG: flagellar hook-basal body complex protein FliE [Rhodospirillales bacterium]|nr:flagellar hook-basal body complex protein FliE [Rhodospirillales bacterium]
MITSANSYTNAIAAYSRAAKGIEIDTTDQPTPEAPGETFASLVKNAISSAVTTAESGEKASLAAVTEGADIGQVVAAVAEAEVTLQTVMAIRDKVVQAYKEISQMPI